MAPVLSSGTYLVFNNNSSRYVYADSFDGIGKRVKTADALDDNSPDNFRFEVTGEFEKQFLNVANGMSLAAGTDEAGNPIVVWGVDTPNNWDIISSDTGIWNIQVFDSDSYWSGDKSGSDHTIPLVSKAGQGDHIQWTLIAA